MTGARTASPPFRFGSPEIEFGRGGLERLGEHVRTLGCTRLLVVSDARVAAAGITAAAVGSLEQAGLDHVLYGNTDTEPEEGSLQAAVAALRTADWDGIVAVGGGSVIDTAKAVNVTRASGETVRAHLQPPLGQAHAPGAGLVPLVAVPTTAGSGSEVTANCAVSVPAERTKGVIRHHRIVADLAVIDPDVTRSAPAEVTAAAGMDAICRALESWTRRPSAGGRNPLADALSERSLVLAGHALPAVLADWSDDDARHDMALASLLSALATRAAGAHLVHACAYPIAGLVRDYRPPGFPDKVFVPHGQAVAVAAPAVFRATYAADPARHEQAARLIAKNDRQVATGPDALPAALLVLMRAAGMPTRLQDLGFHEGDVDALARGALQQTRLVAGAPWDVTVSSITEVLRAAL